MRDGRIKSVFDEIRGLVTESLNPRFSRVDRGNIEEILLLINSEDALVAKAVEKEIPYIAQAVGIIIANISKGGRIFYFGAGTSGRLGIMDAAECPPTFGTDPKLIQGIIAGGEKTVFLSAEGAEDDISTIPSEFKKNAISPPDTVIAISASMRTPFAVEALRMGRSQKCSTIFITCNPREYVDIGADILICPVVGSEVIAGSTRMKSALAQKMILTMISTTVMIKMGKLYKNLMVDLLDRSEKLSARSIRIVMTAVNCDYDTAVSLLNNAGGWVKAAIVMGKLSVSLPEAEKLISIAEGHLHKAFGEQ